MAGAAPHGVHILTPEEVNDRQMLFRVISLSQKRYEPGGCNLKIDPIYLALNANGIHNMSTLLQVDPDRFGDLRVPHIADGNGNIIIQTRDLTLSESSHLRICVALYHREASKHMKPFDFRAVSRAVYNHFRTTVCSATSTICAWNRPEGRKILNEEAHNWDKNVKPSDSACTALKNDSSWRRWSEQTGVTAQCHGIAHNTLMAGWKKRVMELVISHQLSHNN